MSTNHRAEPADGGLVLNRSDETADRPHPGCRLQCRLEGAGRAPAPGCLRSGEVEPHATPPGSTAIRSTRPRATSPLAA